MSGACFNQADALEEGELAPAGPMLPYNDLVIDITEEDDYIAVTGGSAEHHDKVKVLHQLKFPSSCINHQLLD